MSARNRAAVGRRGGYKTTRVRLGADRTPAPAVYVLSEITRPSEQPVEEGGLKEEGEKKKKKPDWESGAEKDGEEAVV